MVETKLNFFLIGAPKAGTTLIHERLALHPQVYLSPLKEPNYYATDIDPERFSAAFRANTPDDLDRYFSQRPLAFRQVAFVRDARQYASLFEGANADHRVVGECSTSYLSSVDAPGRVAESHPDAKILIALRHPVERLYSHWLMARKYGFTDRSLMDAVSEDLAHPDPGWGRSELFVQSGIYAPSIRRWLAHFPAEQVKVVLNEQLNDVQLWSDLASWLNVDSPIPEVPSTAGNRAGRARFEGLNHWLTHRGIKSAISPWLPRGIKAAVGKTWYTSQGLAPLTEADRASLLAHFAEDIVQVEETLGLDLTSWRTGH